jgi:hypothetical protein
MAKAEQVQVVDTDAVEEVVVLEDKMVKVTPKKTLGNMFVGAGWLTIEKDVELEVTQDQKRVLKESDVIYI